MVTLVVVNFENQMEISNGVSGQKKETFSQKKITSELSYKAIIV